MIGLKKKLKIGKTYLASRFQTFPIWIHLWITDNCNLDCSYCYVKDNSSQDPETEEVKEWINHAENLGSIVVQKVRH